MKSFLDNLRPNQGHDGWYKNNWHATVQFRFRKWNMELMKTLRKKIWNKKTALRFKKDKFVVYFIYQYCFRFQGTWWNRNQDKEVFISKKMHLKMPSSATLVSRIEHIEIKKTQQSLQQKKTNNRIMSALFSGVQCIDSLVPRNWPENLKKALYLRNVPTCHWYHSYTANCSLL